LNFEMKYVFGFVVFVLCCLCCSAFMDKYILPNTDATGAVCLDGTPGIYFFKAGSKENSTKWIFHLLGGGMCMSKEECAIRAKTMVGTSSLWPDQFKYGGPLDEDPMVNPDFYDWNHAFFVYCDGASFSGNLDNPVVVGEDKLYYRGFRILTETINDLLANRGLDQATDVLVVGDSAGGMATFYHIDVIKSFMPPSVTRFKAAPFSGVFLDNPNVLGERTFRDTLTNVFNGQNCSGSVNPKCAEAYGPAGEYWRCFFAEYTLNYTDTPMFVLNSPDDVIGLFCIALGNYVTGITNGTGNCSAIPGWEECENNLNCTFEQWSQIMEYGQSFRTKIGGNYKLNQDGNGLFEYSCFTHSIESSYGWNQVKVQGTLMRDAVRDWFFSDNEPASKHTYTDCISTVIPACNPTCTKPVPPGSSSSATPKSTSSSTTSSTHFKSTSSSACNLYPMMSIICATLIALYHILF